MNKTLLLIGSMLFTGVLVAQDSFTIKGKIKDIVEPAKVVLVYQSGGHNVTDSFYTTDGSFIFKGHVDKPSKAAIFLPKGRDHMILKIFNPLTMLKEAFVSDMQFFFLEKGKIKIRARKDMASAIIRGGREQKVYRVLKQQLNPLKPETELLEKSLRMAVEQKNIEEEEKLRIQIEAIELKSSKIEDDFIMSHPDSYVSLDWLNLRYYRKIIPETLEPLYTNLSERMRNTSRGQNLGRRLIAAKNTVIGDPAPQFTQNNTEGVPVSLASFKGKYVFIDFWASWCGPCRSKNPELLKTYQKYKDKNFEILGVSLDENKDHWVAAIKKDGIPWMQVSDLKGTKNKVAIDYGVVSIPDNVLVDPNGIIVAKDLNVKSLEQELAKHIK